MSTQESSDFGATEERVMLRDTLRRFLADARTKAMHDPDATSAGENTNAVWAQLAELGVLHVLFREDVG